MQTVLKILKFSQNHGEGGVELKGGSLHDGFGGFDGFGGLTLRLFYKIQHNEAILAVLTVLAVSVVNVAVSFNHDGYPP